MAGLVPAIHVLPSGTKNVDARDKPGHDGLLRLLIPLPSPNGRYGRSTDLKVPSHWMIVKNTFGGASIMRGPTACGSIVN
ncbi:hypothetical protein IVA80_11500 [Bradyrhizobium sp. 139]|uniref:hypothetical protein n=1 Tax=Bradyrhizobium sp. 139 TaxID=2782616 RepID=UPI001FFB0CF5|nr:hypothetical protein [Bradyrhizobium sp. 139]MCK1741476.1 hypothetical protein [Bradyrhizobium sp. 139]